MRRAAVLVLLAALLAGCTRAIAGLPQVTPQEAEPARREGGEGAFGICLGGECTGEAFLSEDDITSYDSQTHEMVLTPAAVERLHTFVVPTSGVPFVVCVGDEPIYHGAFWTLVSSQSSDGVIIETLAAEMHGAVRIELGYPGPDFFQGPDPRPDPRVLQTLERAGKLK